MFKSNPRSIFLGVSRATKNAEFWGTCTCVTLLEIKSSKPWSPNSRCHLPLRFFVFGTDRHSLLAFPFACSFFQKEVAVVEKKKKKPQAPAVVKPKKEEKGKGKGKKGKGKDVRAAIHVHHIACCEAW